MTSSTDQSALAAVLVTARVKFISGLVVVALVLGIVTEGLSLLINYYTLKKLKCDMIDSMIKVSSSFSLEDVRNNKYPYRHNWLNYAEPCLE